MCYGVLVTDHPARPRKARTTVEVDQDLLDRIRAAAAADKRSVMFMIREALEKAFPPPEPENNSHGS